jgi:hypothetical protein
VTLRIRVLVELQFITQSPSSLVNSYSFRVTLFFVSPRLSSIGYERLMYLLAYCQLGFCISLPIIPELIISLLLFNLDLKITTALLIYTNMPVTTRSQTKASKRSLLYTGSTQLSNSSSLDSLLEPLCVYATETSSINIPSDTSSSSQLTVVNLEETQTVPSSLSLDFQTYPHHFEILENPATISNFQVEPTAFSSHNDKVSKI